MSTLRAAAMRSPGRSRRPVGYVLTAVAVALSAIALAAVTVHHSGQPVYAVPSLVVALALSASALAVAGAAGMVGARRHDVAVLTALIVVLLAVGVVGIFSIGVLFLVTGAGAAVVLRRRLFSSGLALVSGLAMGLGLVTAALIATQEPIVACRDEGTRISSPIWSSTASGSGSTISQPNGHTTGTVIQGSTTYTFTCHRDRLVKFQSSRRE